MNKAHCSRAGRALAKKQTSSAGKALAQCRWGKKKSTAKPKAKAKASAPTRRSRGLAGKVAETVRQPEPTRVGQALAGGVRSIQFPAAAG